MNINEDKKPPEDKKDKEANNNKKNEDNEKNKNDEENENNKKLENKEENDPAKVNLSLNSKQRKLQNKNTSYVLVGIIILCFAGWYFSPKTSKSSQTTKSSQNMDGIVTDSQFVPAATQEALDQQQTQIKALTDKLTEVSIKMDTMQSTLETKEANGSNQANDPTVLDDLRTKIDAIEEKISNVRGSSQNASSFGSTADSHGNGESEASYVRGQEITTVNFTYQDEAESNALKTTKDYVPPGTFASAVLLSGADTNAGVHGQTDTIPIVMKILDRGTIPNGEHSSLKGCFVTAASYGDASSERGQIRLQRLSCVRKDKSILDIPVEGTINDMGGSDGLRGHVVIRNNKIIWSAGFAGFLSGVGNALQQTVAKQSATPLGVATSTIPSQKSFEYGAYGGANTALGKLADYYIKLADMYHPIVQIHAGSKVNVVFLKGFSLAVDRGIKEYIANKTQNETSSNDLLGQGVKQSIQDYHLGESVDSGALTEE